METQMTVSKLNILEKMKWKIKYRDLDQICGQDLRIVKSFLTNKSLQLKYNENKIEILSVLTRAKMEAPEKLEDIVGAIVNALSTPDEENSVAPILSVTLDNIHELLDFKGLQGNATDYIMNQVSEPKLNQPEFKQNLIQLNSLNDYSKDTISKYSFEVLEKIESILSEKDLQTLSDYGEYIINAVKSGVPKAEIQAYAKFITLSKFPKYGDEYNFLNENMQFSSFFLKYGEKYKDVVYEKLGVPGKIEDYFSDTRNMVIKEIMSEMGRTPEFYKELRDKWFDFEINKMDSLNSKKDCIEKKYFNMTFGNIEKIVKEKRESELSQETQSAIRAIKEIHKIKDVSTLMSLKQKLEKVKDSINMGKIFDEVYNLYSKDILNGTFKVDEFSGEKTSIKYDNKEINILKLKGEDFKGVIHSIGNRNPGAKNLGDNGGYDNLVFRGNPRLFTTLQNGASGMSSSIQTDNYMAFFNQSRGSMYIGLELEPENVLGFYSGDGLTSTRAESYEKRIEDLHSLDTKDDLFFADGMYNELFSSRYKETNQPYKLIDKNDRILPKYLLTFKKTNKIDNLPSINYENLNERMTKNLLEFASEYNIPIVEMDTEKYLEKFTEKSNQIKQKIQEGNEEISVEDFYDFAIYERSVSFYSTGFLDKSGPEFLMDILPNINLTEKNANAINEIFQECDFKREDWWKKIIRKLPEKEQETKLQAYTSIKERLKDFISIQQGENGSNEAPKPLTDEEYDRL